MWIALDCCCSVVEAMVIGSERGGRGSGGELSKEDPWAVIGNGCGKAELLKRIALFHSIDMARPIDIYTCSREIELMVHYRNGLQDSAL